MDTTELGKFRKETIDKYITEFTNLLNDEKRNQRRFLARGGFLSAMRDALDQRLKNGWDFLINNPENATASELWFDLLDRYERICDLLDSAKGKVSLPEAAVTIFDGVEYDDKNGRIRLHVAPADAGSPPTPSPAPGPASGQPHP